MILTYLRNYLSQRRAIKRAKMEAELTFLKALSETIAMQIAAGTEIQAYAHMECYSNLLCRIAELKERLKG